MIIYGVAILAAGTLVGLAARQVLGKLCGVDVNIGFGFAMFLLIFATRWMNARLPSGSISVAGIQFWSGRYVPIVVATSFKNRRVPSFSQQP